MNGADRPQGTAGSARPDCTPQGSRCSVQRQGRRDSMSFRWPGSCGRWCRAGVDETSARSASCAGARHCEAAWRVAVFVRPSNQSLRALGQSLLHVLRVRIARAAAPPRLHRGMGWPRKLRPRAREERPCWQPAPGTHQQQCRRCERRRQRKQTQTHKGYKGGDDFPHTSVWTHIAIPHRCNGHCTPPQRFRQRIKGGVFVFNRIHNGCTCDQQYNGDKKSKHQFWNLSFQHLAQMFQSFGLPFKTKDGQQTKQTYCCQSLFGTTCG